MGKRERPTPKERAAAASSAVPSPSPASTAPSNPFVKREGAAGVASPLKKSGTRNKNTGFDGISKRKRVRLDKREKKKAMALAGKLKVAASKEAPAVPLDVRAKLDAAKERERKKRQKQKKKRMERALNATSADKKKRRSRAQVAAESASSPAPQSSRSGASSPDLIAAAAEKSAAAAENNSPSKKMLRKLEMKAKIAAAKASQKLAESSGIAKSPKEPSKKDKKKKSIAPEVADSGIIRNAISNEALSAGDFPYAVDSSDHAETPAVAYADIVPVLSAIAKTIGKSHKDLIIFDPFFCQGSVRSNLAALGFPNVINKKQDFYSNPIPKYDVLLTNPPYSGDHLDKIVEFAVKSSKPWLLLLPNFVVGRSSYSSAISSLDPPPFYVVPAVRYAYIVPSWVGARATAPFPSFWYAHCAGPLPPSLAEAASASAKLNVRAWRAMSDSHPLVIDNIKSLPQDIRDVTDPLKKRPNPRARKRMSV